MERMQDETVNMCLLLPWLHACCSGAVGGVRTRQTGASKCVHSPLFKG